MTAGQEIAEKNPRTLASGDFTGDGVVDLVATNFVMQGNDLLNFVYVLVGQGDGTFTAVVEETRIGGTDAFGLPLAVGDFDADDDLDLAAGDPNADIVSVVLGNGDGTFQPAVNYPAGVPPGPFMLVQPMATQVADFDGDGVLDIATGNHRPSDPPIDSGVSVFLGRGDGTFEPAREFLVARGTESIAVADFNSDGAPDLATPNHQSSNVTILLNDLATAVTVDILVRPSRINPKSHGNVHVAILTTDAFDATDVDPATVRFGQTGTEAAPNRFALEDADGDGNTDIVLRFRIPHTGIECGDTSAVLTGETFGGLEFSGSRVIRTVGCRKHCVAPAAKSKGARARLTGTRGARR